LKMLFHFIKPLPNVSFWNKSTCWSKWLSCKGIILFSWTLHYLSRT
jgi:hypothetical protein